MSVVLARLGVESTALGFVAGFTGDEIERLVQNSGVLCDFLHIGGNSRINVKLYCNDESAINGAGPAVVRCDEERLLEKLSRAGENDIVVLSGSPANSESGKLTENILKAACRARIVADMEGESLLSALSYRPFLIKPNREELLALFSKNEMTESEIISAAYELQSRGARNVLVSLGSEGAILVAADGQTYRSAALSGNVKGTVGAGDSMVAGFISGISLGYKRALDISVAAGSATAFSEGLASAETLLECINKKITAV